MRERFCLKCGVRISEWGTYCRKCATKESVVKRNNFGKNNPNYKDGRWLIKHYCKDCGIEVGVYSKQCKPCFRKNPPFKIEKKKCINCGKEVNNQRTIRCRKCKNLIWRGENHPCWLGKKAYCIDCGKLLSNIKKKRCLVCANTGKRNPVWNNGSSFEPYPYNWNNFLKEKIRERDGYKCQRCGVPQLECKRKLCVHHIDYNKKNLSINNLITLCISCHAQTNKNREIWKNKLQIQNTSI